MLNLRRSTRNHELLFLQNVLLEGKNETPELINGQPIIGVHRYQVENYALENRRVLVALSPKPLLLFQCLQIYLSSLVIVN